MKCHICDKDLTEKEVSWNKDLKAFEPCSECLEIIFDTAFSDGFSRPDEDDVHVLLEDVEHEEKGANYFATMLSTWSTLGKDIGEDE